MTTLLEAAKQALETFERMNHEDSIFAGEFDEEITALRQAIEQAENQEPVAWMCLMKEARDNCKASIVEDGISAMRKEYRVDLERRLTDFINTHPQPQQEKP